MHEQTIQELEAHYYAEDLKSNHQNTINVLSYGASVIGNNNAEDQFSDESLRLIRTGRRVRKILMQCSIQSLHIFHLFFQHPLKERPFFVWLGDDHRLANIIIYNHTRKACLSLMAQNKKTEMSKWKDEAIQQLDNAINEYRQMREIVMKSENWKKI